MSKNIQAVIMVTVVLISVGIVSCVVGANSAENQKAMEIRLRILEDKEQIHRLLFDYGKFLDQRNFAAFSKLFAPEGEWVGGMGKAKGPKAIRKLMEQSIGTESAGLNFHLFMNQIIDIDGDRAVANTKWIFVIRGDGNRPQPVYLGHYEDSLVRVKSKWKFLRRTVTSDIPADTIQSSSK